MKTYDISLFNLDNYSCTEDLYDFYERIGWIEPTCITGYSKSAVKDDNLLTFNQGRIDDTETADEMIASFYDTLFYYQPNVEKLIDVSIWLITELADSTPTYIFPSFLRQQLQQLDNDTLNTHFNTIYQAIQRSLTVSPYIITYLLTEFLFESFQYGSEWGVYVEPKDKPSIITLSMTVEEVRLDNYLCANLSDENIARLASLETIHLNFPH